MAGETTPPSQKTTAPQPPPASDISEARQKKLDIMWKAYEQTYGLAMSSVKGYRKQVKNDSNAAKLDDPKVAELAVEELGKQFKKKIAAELSDVEINYLTQLFSSAVAKKLSQIETNFWTPDGTLLIIKKITNPPLPQAPASPSVPAAQTKSITPLPPKK